MENKVFKENINYYRKQLIKADFSKFPEILNIAVDGNVATVPYLQSEFQVSPDGVENANYSTSVVLFKHLLMCPLFVPSQTTWTHPREFKDAGHSSDAGLSETVLVRIADEFKGNAPRLKDAIARIGGIEATDMPYDLAARISVLPRLPVLLLFNDAEEGFPAEAKILYEQRAPAFLDAECRAMVDYELYRQLKKAA